MRTGSFTLALFAALALSMQPGSAQTVRPQQASSTTPHPRVAQEHLVWLDTDIGDDIDDAFALAFLLRTPEIHLVGISTAFGDTETRARLVDRFLAQRGLHAIPVTAGLHTSTQNPMTQRRYATRWPAHDHPDGVTALLRAIHAHPHQLTLLAIGPLFNLGAAIQRDPQGFRLLRQVVLMGGSIRRGYDAPVTGAPRPPDAEWNILQSPQDAARLFASGVDIEMMPLDSTQVRVLLPLQDKIFSADTPLTDQLTLLYHQWASATGNRNPTLFDVVAAETLLDPSLCPVQPMRISVESNGFTRTEEGAANAHVCLESDAQRLLDTLEHHLVPSGQ